MSDQKPEDRKSKPGPEEERLVVDGDWKDAMKKAIGKEKPEGGWPDEPTEDDKAPD